MSKERARRREIRAKEAAIVAAARASSAERREHRATRQRALRSRLPPGRSRPTGVLAQRRRSQSRALFAALAAVNVLVWYLFPAWPIMLMSLIVTVLVTPVLHTLLFRP